MLYTFSWINNWTNRIKLTNSWIMKFGCFQVESLDLISMIQSLDSQPLFIQFSCSVVSDSSRPHEPQHTRPPCLSPTPEVHPNPCPLSRWCHPTISSSVIPFSCTQSFPTSGSFQMCQFFASGGQHIGVSASASVLPMNVWDGSPLEGTGWISLLFKGLKSFLQCHSSKASVLGDQLSL